MEMDAPIRWMGQARGVVCAALGIDALAVVQGGAVAERFAGWVDSQLPGLEAAALERPEWPVRGELVVGGVSRAVFLFVSPGVGLPWMAWVLDRSGAGEEAGGVAGLGRLDGAALRCVPAPSIDAGGLLVDWSVGGAWLDGEPLDLTPLQFSVLSYLARHPGVLFSRRELLERLWEEPGTYEHAVEAAIYRLRRDLRDRRWLISNVRRAGYRFDGLRGRSEVLEFGELRIDVYAHRAWDGPNPIKLPPRQASLLSFLARHAGTAFSNQQLLEHIWGTGSLPERTVAICVARLRRNLGRHGRVIAGAYDSYRFGPPPPRS
jgi:DNA-binding response OmpR family regulator